MELEYKHVGDVECITASGTPKEMAALVLELQGRRRNGREAIHKAIGDILAEQLKADPISRLTTPAERGDFCVSAKETDCQSR